MIVTNPAVKQGCRPNALPCQIGSLEPKVVGNRVVRHLTGPFQAGHLGAIGAEPAAGTQA